MAKNLFTLTVKTTTPADSELLVGGTGSANAYNFTWTKLREWVGDTASFIFTGSVTGTKCLFNNITEPQGVFTGWSQGVDNVSAGEITLGGTAAFKGVVSYNPAGNTILSINNTFDDAGSVIDFNLRTDGTPITALSLNGSGDAAILGALSKGSGSFKIDHPLKPDTHYLVHSFTESPQADLIYRDTVKLINGKAEVNIDLVSDMTDGTFDALCGNVQCFTSNETGWDLVKGSVNGNILTIQSKTTSSADTISWMVIGERKDKHMIETSWTDKDGHVIVEPEKKKDAK